MPSLDMSLLYSSPPPATNALFMVRPFQPKIRSEDKPPGPKAKAKATVRPKPKAKAKATAAKQETESPPLPKRKRTK